LATIPARRSCDDDASHRRPVLEFTAAQFLAG